MDAQTIIAKRIAQELRDGMLVNLGIGIPTLVSKYVPAGLHVYFQSENGLIGTGAPPAEGMHHRLLTDAGGKPVTALPGAATFDSALSFGLIRGGHLDMTVLGALRKFGLKRGVASLCIGGGEGIAMALECTPGGFPRKARARG
jgi:acetate CoA/acetoacetate CoA-transferase beta subunit